MDVMVWSVQEKRDDTVKARSAACGPRRDYRGHALRKGGHQAPQLLRGARGGARVVARGDAEVDGSLCIRCVDLQPHQRG